MARAGAQAEPEKAAGAIALGLQAYQKEDYGEAIHLFKKALELPGTGIKQYRHVSNCLPEKLSLVAKACKACVLA